MYTDIVPPHIIVSPELNLHLSILYTDLASIPIVILINRDLTFTLIEHHHWNK